MAFSTVGAGSRNIAAKMNFLDIVRFFWFFEEFLFYVTCFLAQFKWYSNPVFRVNEVIVSVLLGNRLRGGASTRDGFCLFNRGYERCLRGYFGGQSGWRRCFRFGFLGAEVVHPRIWLSIESHEKEASILHGMQGGE